MPLTTTAFHHRRFGGPPPVAPGTYRVVLSVDGEEFAQNVRVEPDPIVSDALMTGEQPGLDEDEEEEMEQEGQPVIHDLDADEEIGN